MAFDSSNNSYSGISKVARMTNLKSVILFLMESVT